MGKQNTNPKVKPEITNRPEPVFVDYADLTDKLTGKDAPRIMKVEAFRYDGGTFKQYDYNTPSNYGRYSSTKWGGDYSTSRTDPYVRNGHDNKYPFFILKFSKKSATFQRAYKTSKNVAQGDGFVFSGMTDTEAARLAEWLKLKKIDRNLLDGLTSNVAMFGGAFPLMNFKRESAGKVSLVDIQSHNFQNVRVGKPDDYGDQKYHWHSARYNQNTQRRDLKGFPVWTSLDDVARNYEEAFVVDTMGKPYFVNDLPTGLGKFMYAIKNSNIYSEFNPSAPWESDAAINAALLEDAISLGDVASKENGMTAAYIVSVPLAQNQRNPEQYKKDKAAIDEKLNSLQGVENTDKYIVVYTDPRAQGQGIEIAAIPHNNTSDMGELMGRRKDQILLTAFGVVDGQLIGIPPQYSKGLQGQATALSEADDIWYTNYIQPEIVQPIEEFLNGPILEVYSGETGVTLPSEARVSIKRLKRFRRTPSDPVLLANYSKDEIREKFGDGKMTDEVRKELEAQPKVVPPKA